MSATKQKRIINKLIKALRDDSIVDVKALPVIESKVSNNKEKGDDFESIPLEPYIRSE